jgi:hypothetical protein
MFKKFISSIIFIAFLNLLGCYSFQSYTVIEYKQIEETEGKPNEIKVKVDGSREYHFTDSNFYIEKDTLYGRGKIILNSNEQPFDGEVAVSEIESIEVEKLNVLETVGAIAGITVVLIIGIVTIAAIEGPSL